MNKKLVSLVGLIGSIASITALLYLFVPEKPEAPIDDVQSQSGSGNVQAGRDNANVKYSTNVQIVQGDAKVYNSFPKPTRIDARFSPETNILSIVKTPGSFVVNPKVEIYRALDLHLFGNCNCGGDSNSVSVHVSSISSITIHNSEDLVADIDIKDFLEESIEVTNKWTLFNKKYGLCGASTMSVPVKVSYDDQFATNRNAYFELHRDISPLGLFSEWKIDSANDEKMVSFAKRYFESRDDKVSRNDTEEEIFQAYIRRLKKKFGGASIADAAEMYKDENTFILAKLSLWNYANLLAFAQQVDKDASGLAEKREDCVFDRDLGSRFKAVPGFKPITVIDPPDPEDLE